MSDSGNAPKPTVAQVTMHLVNGNTLDQDVARGQRLLDRLLQPGDSLDHLSGRDLIHEHFSGEGGAPPRKVELEVRMPGGLRSVVVPYNDTKVPRIRRDAKLRLG